MCGCARVPVRSCGPRSGTPAELAQYVRVVLEISTIASGRDGRGAMCDGVSDDTTERPGPGQVAALTTSRRPAPVIVNWLGYPGTMGSPYHHYLVADDWLVPESHELYFSERVLRLPCYQPSNRACTVAPTGAHPRPGRPARGGVRLLLLQRGAQAHPLYPRPVVDGPGPGARLEGRLPRSDLANLEAYLDARVDVPHEELEVQAVPDYLRWWQELLARRLQYRPIPPDRRLLAPPT
jgi:hypothetical protein